MNNNKIIEVNKNNYLLDIKYLGDILNNGLDSDTHSINQDEVLNIDTPVILNGEKNLETNLFQIEKIIFKSECDKQIIKNIWGDNDKFEYSTEHYKNLNLEQLLKRNYIKNYSISNIENEISIDVDVSYNLNEDINLKLMIENSLGKTIDIPSWAINIKECDNDISHFFNQDSKMKKYKIQTNAVDDKSHKLKIYLNNKLSIIEYVGKFISK